MKPYLYNPLPQLGFLNMPGNTNILMGNQVAIQSQELGLYNQQQYMDYKQ